MKMFSPQKVFKIVIWVATYELQSNMQNESLNLIVGLKCVRKKTEGEIKKDTTMTGKRNIKRGLE